MDPHEELGDFRIEGKLGQGAMGTVYRAHQISLNRTAALNHPHIVQIYAAGESDGTHFFAMEYVDGEMLGKHVDRKGRLDPREALAVAIHVARALDYAWKRARIIHRDIKPDNIFLSREGEVKVGDPGLAKVLGAQAASATQTGLSMGSPFYVSREQAVGNRDLDFRADIYSLGCTLFHMLTGTTPYEGDSAMGVLLPHLTQPPPEFQTIWPECPPAIVGLFDRMLRKDAGARHQSYEELLDDLTWVSEKIEEQPEAPASPAISMIVPTPRAITTAPVAVGRAVAKTETVLPTARGNGILYGVIAGGAALPTIREPLNNEVTRDKIGITGLQRGIGAAEVTCGDPIADRSEENAR